jgi:outer membrane protein
VGIGLRGWRGVAGIAAFSLAASAAHGETLGDALAKAYVNNPDINQQRAGVRSTDEGVPKANAGFLPTVNAEADVGVQRFLGSINNHFQSTTEPSGFGLTINQTIWNGNRVGNSVKQAETNVMSAREQMRLTEETVLLGAATAYMDVLRDSAIVSLNESNVQVLKEQLRQTKDRFDVGEVTRTDVAQAESSLAGAEAQALTSSSNLQSSTALYRYYVGDQPKNLSPAGPLGKLLPKSQQEALGIGQLEHPSVVEALHAVDSAELSVKLAEGALAPTLGISGSVAHRYDPNNIPGSQDTIASVIGQLNIPIYQGGAEYASIRQAKESLSQAQLQADLARDKVRAQVVSAWGQNQNSLGVVRAARAQVAAAEIALAGTREEAKVGQRTTLDVLNAQQTLLNARVQLVTAQHDEVVNSYNLMSSIGRLSPQTLGLQVAAYDPRVHFDQVKGKLFGTQTPDGK